MFSELAIRIAKARELKRNARLSRPALEALKLVKFRRLVRHVVAESPYYARIARERGVEANGAVPGDFPVLTKSILMTNFDEIVTRREITKRSIAEFLSRSHDPTELFLGKYRVIHTSGSSGEVGYFVYSPEDWARGDALGRRRRQRPSGRKRRKSGRFRFAFFGATDGHYAGVTMMSSLSRGLARLFVDVRLYEINSPLTCRHPRPECLPTPLSGGIHDGAQDPRRQAATRRADALAARDRGLGRSHYSGRQSGARAGVRLRRGQRLRFQRAPRHGHGDA